MIKKSMMQAVVSLVDDLSRELPDSERYRRLLDTVRTLLPCDAAALLRLDGDWLVPLAVNGLSSDALGRRFKVAEHPRFRLLLAADGPTRFPPDSELPDPYDGLVDGMQGHLEVHDCMGCPVQPGENQGKPWGVLTIDALDKERFSTVDLADLQAFASLAAATVSVAERIDRLASRVEDERQRADTYRALPAKAASRRSWGKAPRTSAWPKKSPSSATANSRCLSPAKPVWARNWWRRPCTRHRRGRRAP
jgi:anaerobic nitric oxide reductase transcription regulator